jgi:hypothetical protein
MPDFSGDFFESRSDKSQDGNKKGMPVTLYDLIAYRSRG